MSDDLAASENHKRLTQCSTSVPTSLSEQLKPATAAAGTAELMACLTLVAPSGMSAEDRNAWIRVARATLKGIPADLLTYGCKRARETCRFASEIVPTIFEATRSSWDWRRRCAEESAARAANKDAPRLERPKYGPVPHEETQRIIREAREAMRA